MRRTIPAHVSHRGGISLMLTLLASALVSCVDSESVRCSSGWFCPAGWRCSASGEACIVDSCGDGILQEGEACDDGNTLSRDGCSSDCSSNETCGNGIEDPGEACDDGDTLSGNGCSSDCQSDETCGNGVRDASEVCDYGDALPGDGCSADCKSNESCGNGIKDLGETCDDGNNVDEGICSADCQVAGMGCGNSRVDGSEECDDGDQSNENSCLNTCKWARCGDGLHSPDAPHGEGCDGGGETASCDLDCTPVVCGDGVVNGRAGEQCDNGAVGVDTAHCTMACRVSSCGDGYLNEAADERCDDGNGDYCGSCSSTCDAARLPTRATGFIDAAPASKLNDGETFTLDDGRHPYDPVTFEFSDGPIFSRNVHILRMGSRSEMAIAVMNAINSQGPLQITATIDPNKSDRVLLTHDYPTSYGNRPIRETVANEHDFSVGHMAGGAAGDCLQGVGCTITEDCAPGLVCRDKRCLPP